jgi:hypothetical protein
VIPHLVCPAGNVAQQILPHSRPPGRWPDQSIRARLAVLI